jgi:hypothetical protein
MLLGIRGIYATMPVVLPRPLPSLIRSLIEGDAHQDRIASLTALEQAIRDQSVLA